MAKAKKPTRSWIPFGELSRRQNMVASMIPVTKTAPSLIPKSSGILREFVIDRLDITTISIQEGLANVGNEEDDRLLVSFGAPETSLPLEMLALMASLRESLGPFMERVSFGWWDLVLVACHDLLNSTRLLVPPGVSSSSRIKSRANSVLFSFSGIGCPNSAKNRGRLAGEPP
ncbi:hypothetical protein TorRG33x02_014380 [Trema orientale]|uniref:Uncharacterized protein n=1 Tax=Trema orientale TaxID=63057 RepID=A0A2P5FXF0_TREOI|nr:hypothetical protein TorRG33x02_014380 [Trema orientale]